jgi:WD40 repeat protein
MAEGSYRIFISSPGDVGPERRRAALIVEKLAREYARFIRVSPYLWEYEPMLASGHFQDVIAQPRDSDLVIVILWSRLGTPLPERTANREYRGLDGRVPVTGTEWEFEDALAGRQATGSPDLLIYRKTAEPTVSLVDEKRRRQAEDQWQALQGFWGRHFASEGEFRTAFAAVAGLDEFAARLESDLRRMIEARIAVQPSTSAKAARHFGNPFRGLRAYSPEDANLFFGRATAVRECAERLGQRRESGMAFFLVRGASGSGKSSLVQAGVLPALTAPGVVPGIGLWRYAVARPAGHAEGPFAALAQALLSEKALPELAEQLTAADLAAHLHANAMRPELPLRMVLDQVTRVARSEHKLLQIESAHLVLVMDQLEELFTANVQSDEQKAFVQCLVRLASSGIVSVICTMRSDYWHRAADTPQLVTAVEGFGTYDLLAAGPAELSEIVRRPAELAGISFEMHSRTGIALDAQLLEEAAREPGALPLLSYMLDGLYRQDIEKGEGTVLRHESADRLGGLKGAIATRAEETLARLPADVQAVLPRLLRALVTVSHGGDTPTSRSTSLDQFQAGGPLRQLVDALLAPDVRLLVSEGDQREARIRVAHEALLTHWARAREHLDRDATDLRLLGSLEHDAKQWQDRSRNPSFLLADGLPLQEAVDLSNRWRDDLPSSLHDYVAASEEHVLAARRKRRAGLVAAFAMLSVLVVMATWQWRRASARELETRQQSAVAALRAANEEREKGNIRGVLARVARALRLDPDNRSIQLAAFNALDTLGWTSLRARPTLLGKVDIRAVSPDGARVATSSKGVVQIRSLLTGETVGDPMQHEGAVRRAAFSPDGQLLVTGSADKTAQLWDVPTGRRVGPAMRHDAAVRSLRFSPSGKQVVTGTDAAAIRVWDVPTGQPVTEPIDGGIPTFSPDGQRFAMSSDKTVQVWDARTGRKIGRAMAHKERSIVEAFSPDGTLLLTSSRDGAQVWNAATGESLAMLQHDSRFATAAFTPDGRHVVTLAGNAVHFWEATSGRADGEPLTLDSPHYHVEFSANGRRMLTRSSAEVRVWDVATRQALGPPIAAEQDGSITEAVFVSDGSSVMVVSYDAQYTMSARFWREVPPLLAGRQIPIDGELGAIRFSADGRRLLTAIATGSLPTRLEDIESLQQIATAMMGRKAQVWDTDTGQPIGKPLLYESVAAAALAPDGSRVLTASLEGKATLWDVASGTPIGEPLPHEHNVVDAAFSQDGTLIATASRDGIRVWNASSAKPEIETIPHDELPCMVAFDPSGRRLVSSWKKTARVWDARTGQARSEPMVHDEPLCGIGWGLAGAVMFRPDGVHLVTADEKNRIRLWDADSGRLIGTPLAEPPRGDVTLSPGGNRALVMAMDGRPFVLDLLTGEPVGKRLTIKRIGPAAFSPDANLLVIGTDLGAEQLWDGITGEFLGSIQRGGPVRKAFFSRNGERIAVMAEVQKTPKLFVWSLPKATRAEVAWLAELLDLASGLGVNESDALVPAADREPRTQELRQTAQSLSSSNETDVARLLRSFLLDPKTDLRPEDAHGAPN